MSTKANRRSNAVRYAAKSKATFERKAGKLLIIRALYTSPIQAKDCIGVLTDTAPLFIFKPADLQEVVRNMKVIREAEQTNIERACYKFRNA